MGSEDFDWRHLAPKKEKSNMDMAMGFRVAEDKKQDRQCRCNLILRCLSANIVLVENTKY